MMIQRKRIITIDITLLTFRIVQVQVNVTKFITTHASVKVASVAGPQIL
jgi:hypothetical protein